MKRARGQMGKPAASVGAAFLHMGGFIMKSGNMLMALMSLAFVAAMVMLPGSAEAMQVKQGTFMSGTATGNVNITGVGFQPKAVIFYWTRQGNAAYNQPMSAGMGFAAGVTPANYSRSVSGDDAVTTGNFGRFRSDTYSIYLLSNGTPTASGRASVTAWGADGFTVNWNQAPGLTSQIHYLAIGGADITVKAGTFTVGATGNVNVTGVGFTPDFYMLLASSTEAVDTAATGADISFGMSDGTNQAAVNLHARDASTGNTRTGSEVNNAKVLTGATPNSSYTNDFDATHVSMGADGFTVNFATLITTNLPVSYLAISGGIHKVGMFTKSTAAGAQNVTGVGFTPEGLFLSSTAKAATGAIRSGTDPNSEMLIGATDGTTQGAIWGGFEYGTNYDSNIYNISTRVLNFATSTTTETQANFTSFDADGFTLNWSATGNADLVPYWAMKTACTDSDLATITTTAPTSGTTLGGTYTIQAQIGTEATPSGMTGMAVTIAGTTGGTCDVSGAGMTWNPGTSRWEYSWDTSACGNPADGGITIDVTGTDPDCNTVVNAAQIINITIDNTCSDGDPTTGFTINPPTSSSTISGNYLVQATVAGESSPGTGSATITIAGSSSCDVTGTAMTWNSGNSKWEYTWNTSACGDPVEVGITLDAVYTDPDCSDTTNATQITSITLDNTDPYSIVGCNGCHTSPPSDAPGGIRNTPEGAVAGSHFVHSSSLGLACTECHIDNGSTLPHRTGIINMTSIINATTGSSYSGGTSITQTKTPSLGTCANTYCHSAGTSFSAPFSSTSPTWGDSTTCTSCHSKPPAYANGSPKANSHAKHSSNCSLCHNATTSDGGNSITGPANHGNKAYDVVANAGQIGSYTSGTKTCNNVCCHGGTSPVWGGASIGCTTCHNGSVCSPEAEGLDAAVTSRRAVSGEFGMTWSHKRTASGVVTSNDCGVCHMEGIASTGLSNATYHANGYVEIRDPDTGNTIYNAAWTGTDAGSVANTADVALFVRFSRDLASNSIEPTVLGIQKNHCLKCHDAAGAASTSARVPSGTALRPFNTAPTHTPGNNVLNVDAHFTTTNSSYHPVKGKQNNSYADIDRMKTPWNQATKTAATTTQWGDLMSCWDCHARPSDSGTLTNTVTAHGAADTIRGTAWVTGNPSSANRVTLCVLCHQGYDASGTMTSHSTNSAFSGNTGRSEKNAPLAYGCFYCHSSSDTAARPTRSADVHGFSGTWGGGTVQTAFIRSSSHMTLHNPKAIGATTYTNPQCTGMAGGLCGGTGPGTRNEVYTVGGYY